MLLPLYIVAAAVLATTTATILRCLRKHPLDCFPGPCLARWTSLYRAYYDIIVGGGWLSHLAELHETYGPVVRVGYNELHFSDPAAYADIYMHSPVHHKDPGLYNGFTWTSPSSFSETDIKEHTVLKAMLSSFFSRKKVLELENMIQERVDRLHERLMNNHCTTFVDMDSAFRSLTLDIITLYTFGISIDAVSAPSFEHPVLTDLKKHSKNKWFYRHFPLLKQLVMKLPSWFATLSRKKATLAFVQEIMRLVDTALEGPQSGDSDPLNKNIFNALLTDDRRTSVRTEKLTREWLVGEGQNLRGAGSDTVANTCTIGCRRIIGDGRVLRKLQRELDEAWPDKDATMPLERLEKLPYLTAVIKECLRVGHGVVTPMSRIVPESGSMIAGYPVPPGTAVAIGHTFVHMNRAIFPEPERFYPERWLNNDNGHPKLEKFLVSFSKGPRSCLGINLAWSELYLILGNIFRKLELSPVNDISGNTRILDYFVPFYEEKVLEVTVKDRE
ncbi:cytochrome P450 [Marasmius fiardii PR-910]|nr:cytochrome P450 [Marasmius fiardii PR-910]